MITKDGQHEGCVDGNSTYEIGTKEWAKAHNRTVLTIPRGISCGRPYFQQLWFHESTLKLAKTVMDDILEHV